VVEHKGQACEKESVMNTAEDVIQRHAQAINQRDLASYLETMNFPFTYQNYNGVALTVDKASDCGVGAPLPWAIILKTDPHWHHTDVDFMEEVARSPSSVVFKVGLSRVDDKGDAYGRYQAIWIATCQQGHWGVQFRHNLGVR
jgi:hypothetical protein